MDSSRCGIPVEGDPDRRGMIEQMKEKGGRTPWMAAVSGVKNSGKTTLITRLIPYLSAQGLQVAVIKHDGHDFAPDVPGTDTHACLEAGAYGTAVFSGSRFMAVKQAAVTERELARLFPEADLILLEGMKYSPYPKLELVREGNSDRPVCARETILGLVCSRSAGFLKEEAWAGLPVFEPEEAEEIAGFLLDHWYARTRLSMAVLAGGESRRMGQDKAGLVWNGRTLLECQLEKGRRLGIRDQMASGARESAFSAGKSQESHGQTFPEQNAGADTAAVSVVPDNIPKRGPLGGIEAVLRAADPGSGGCLILSVDTPLVPESELLALVRAFRTRKPGERAVVLRHGSSGKAGKAAELGIETGPQNRMGSGERIEPGERTEPGAQMEPEGRIEPLIGIYETSLAEEASRMLSDPGRKASIRAFLERFPYAIYESPGPEHWFSNINDPDAFQRLLQAGAAQGNGAGAG